MMRRNELFNQACGARPARIAPTASRGATCADSDTVYGVVEIASARPVNRGEVERSVLLLLTASTRRSRRAPARLGRGERGCRVG